MTDPSTPASETAGPGVSEPVLVVMWHGNRVQVFGDGNLRADSRRTTQQKHHAMGDIANAITDAETVEDIVSALQASTAGETHDVEVRIADRLLQVWLRERRPDERDVDV